MTVDPARRTPLRRTIATDIHPTTLAPNYAAIASSTAVPPPVPLFQLIAPVPAHPLTLSWSIVIAGTHTSVVARGLCMRTTVAAHRVIIADVLLLPCVAMTGSLVSVATAIHHAAAMIGAKRTYGIPPCGPRSTPGRHTTSG